MRTPTAGNRGGLKIEDIMKAKDTSMFFRIKGERDPVKRKTHTSRGQALLLHFSESNPTYSTSSFPFTAHDSKIVTRTANFILSGKTTSFGRGQSELAVPEGNKSIGGVME